jgi:GxxExxY protein
MSINELTEIVISRCIKIHSKVGPGCFESVYEELLYYELCKMGLQVERQILMPVEYEELYIKKAYKLDLLIENRLITEIKCIYPLPAVYFKQIRTHLWQQNLKHGLIANFKVELMKDGIHRVFNNRGRDPFDF